MASYNPGIERVGKGFTEENSIQSCLGDIDQAPFEGDERKYLMKGKYSFPCRGSTAVGGNPRWSKAFSCWLSKNPTCFLWYSGSSPHRESLSQSSAPSHSPLRQVLLKITPSHPTYILSPRKSHTYYPLTGSPRPAGTQSSLFMLPLLPQAEIIGDIHQINHVASLKHL